MKNNKLKIIVVSLLLGATSSQGLYSAQQPQEPGAYQALCAGTSNTAYFGSGVACGQGLAALGYGALKISLNHWRNPSAEDQEEKIKNYSTAAFYRFGSLTLTGVGLAVLSQVTLGYGKENNDYFFCGLVVGAGQKALSYARSYLKEEDKCGICQEAEAPINPHADDVINNPNDIRELGCHHKFHHQCINEWLVQQRTCPMCRADVQPA